MSNGTEDNELHFSTMHNLPINSLKKLLLTLLFSICHMQTCSIQSSDIVNTLVSRILYFDSSEDKQVPQPVTGLVHALYFLKSLQFSVIVAGNL